MQTTAYLTLSRHRVYYFRWPLPHSLHPHGRHLYIRVSLRTRERREALRLSRSLGYLGETLTAQGIASGMRYDEIRAVLTKHFSDKLAQHKARIAEHGRLDHRDIAALNNSLGFAAQAVETGEPLDPTTEGDSEVLGRFCDKYGIAIPPGTAAYATFRTDFMRAFHAYCQSALAYDQSLETFDLEPPAPVVQASAPPAPAEPGPSLRQVADEYIDENMQAKRWAPKTELEKREHFALLYEIVGEDIDIRAINFDMARPVKTTIRHYPKNRNKSPATAGLSLADALTVGAPTIGTKTQNNYLQSYIGLFAWAKDHGYVDANPFANMRIQQDRNQSDEKRVAFTTEQVHHMLDEILNNTSGLIRKDYQRWGPLIGLFTGARLNEIAQMHLDDIRQDENVWFFDLNEDDGNKRLKNASSRRTVPVHSKLIELGLLEYVQTLRKKGETKLFPEFTYDNKNGWGRALGRWFNETFLVKLDMKSKELVFHCLRHTVVTHLLREGVEQSIVQALVGHARDGVTQNNYFKMGYSLPQKSAALERLPFNIPEARS
ncbi:site-specific integrase [Magnetospirillum sp. 15-1]|uniref:site-specific integrase n=1 Tax=Magnetospirillum sp. 15-1 TaxID=1979370 RepID=UPI000BBCC890|nr:site-specific integrase [Magnetospirillum sp. 15-1]